MTSKMRISLTLTLSLLDSFQGLRGIPTWNLSLVFHQLTKTPFEPMKEASFEHLIFKTFFLFSLGSGKGGSVIHVWQNKNIRHQSDWSKISLHPSPSFLSKNHLAKEGPDSVAPVVIPPLVPTLDKSLKVPLSGQSTALLLAGFDRHLTCHYLPMDQTDYDPVLGAL